MASKRERTARELQEMDEWLTKLFLDPLTLQLDETTFHIDIFETGEEYIIEAILPDYHRSELSVCLNEKMICICADGFKRTDKKSRTIEFPFPVIKRNVSAYFENGVLEIYISKDHWEYGKNRLVPIL